MPKALELLRERFEEAYYRDYRDRRGANDHPLNAELSRRVRAAVASVDKSDFAAPLDFAYRLREQVEVYGARRAGILVRSRRPPTGVGRRRRTSRGSRGRLLSLRRG